MSGQAGRREVLGLGAGTLGGLALRHMLQAEGRLRAAEPAPREVAGGSAAEEGPPIRPRIDPANPNGSRGAHFEPRARQVLMIFCAGSVISTRSTTSRH